MLARLWKWLDQGWSWIADNDGRGFRFCLLLVALGLILFTALVTLRDFPNSADEYSYLISAQIFSEGKLSVPSPPHQEFFTFFHVINFGKFYSKYPPGWPLILASGALLGIPWIVNPLLALATIVLLHRMLREHVSLRSANIAAILLLTSPFFIFNFASYFSHSSGLFLITAFMFFYLKCLRSPELPLGMYLAMGVCAGLAFLARPFTAVVLLSCPAVYLVAHAVRTGQLASYAYRFTPTALVFGAFLALFLFYNHAQTGDALRQPFSLWDPTDQPGFSRQGFDLALAWRQNISLRLRELNDWTSYAPFLVLASLFWRDSHRPLGLLLLSMFLALLGAYFLYFGDAGNRYGPRYLYEGSLVLFALPAIAISRIGRIGALVVLVILVLNASVFLEKSRFHAQQVRERMTLYDEVERQGITNAIVFLKTGSGSMPAGDLTRNGIHFDGPVLYVWDLGPKNETLVDAHPDRDAYYFSYDDEEKRGYFEPFEDPRNP
jgi:4-amino-4-deoxy-L-arabinose transferase-like glycosyltransferase